MSFYQYTLQNPRHINLFSFIFAFSQALWLHLTFRPLISPQFTLFSKSSSPLCLCGAKLLLPSSFTSLYHSKPYLSSFTFIFELFSIIASSTSYFTFILTIIYFPWIDGRDPTSAIMIYLIWHIVIDYLWY